MKNIKPLSINQTGLNRRSFLKLSGIFSLGALAAGVGPITAEAGIFDKKQYKVSKTGIAMGTFVAMTLIHESKDKAKDAINLAFDEIRRLEKILSRFENANTIARLNKDGHLKNLPPEVAYVIGESLEYFKLSRGNFDITVKPIMDLLENSKDGKARSLPGDKEIRKALKLVGSQNIRLDGRNVYFNIPGMGITLDGIAKGYIVDHAAKVISEQGIKNHLINAGGDIRASGSKPEGKPWTVAIEDPNKKGNYPDIIKIKGKAVATSGNYEIFFDQEKKFHHIINPRTGLSPALCSSVSILTSSTMKADALSTAVFVMGPKDGIEFIESLPDCEGLIIDKDGSLLKSKGWKGKTV